MRTLTALFLVVLSTGFLVTANAEDEESSYPKVYCVTFHKDGDAACAAIEKAFMAKLRKEFAEKNVLFLTADVTSRATRHQARLLMNALSLGEVWEAHAEKPGTVVVAEPEWANVKATFTNATKEADARKALAKALTAKGMDEDDG